MFFYLNKHTFYIQTHVGGWWWVVVGGMMNLLLRGAAVGVTTTCGRHSGGRPEFVRRLRVRHQCQGQPWGRDVRSEDRMRIGLHTHIIESCSRHAPGQTAEIDRALQNRALAMFLQASCSRHAPGQTAESGLFRIVLSPCSWPQESCHRNRALAMLLARLLFIYTLSCRPKWACI